MKNMVNFHKKELEGFKENEITERENMKKNKENMKNINISKKEKKSGFVGFQQ
jgi:hypothetical protein